MARFFVPKKDLQGNRGSISGQELDHMRKVLRLRPGDRVTLFDDEGWEHEAIIRSYTEHLGEVDILKSSKCQRESPMDITLAQALGKGEKMDLIVEKATELGVGTISPFLSSRTIPRLDKEKMARRQTRWRKIALSAAKQSGRARIPEILDVSDFADLVRKPWQCELKLLFWEGEARQTLTQIRDERPRLNSLLVVIGPEGGFSSEEALAAIRHGFKTVRMGERILRTETAALAALTIAQFLWGDMG
ncbi:MAG: 16S rRNA (uracil(1498)-N(3))-methyltransferase [Candidatus Binatota bacterium]